jgi:hypothetical protein
MANQQRPNEQEPKSRDPLSPGGMPGTKRDPHQHPGNEPDVQPDVIGGEGHPSQNESGKRPGGPGTTDKPRTGNTGGNRSNGQEEGK